MYGTPILYDFIALHAKTCQKRLVTLLNKRMEGKERT